MKKAFLTSGIAFIALAVLTTSCNNGTGDKSAKDSTVATAKPVPGTPIKYDSSKRYIFLTWDDCPQPPGTTNCKAVFTSENVKATFFGVGFNMVGPLKKRLIDSLRNGYPQFLLANHSFSHAHEKYKQFYAKPDSAYADFMRNAEVLQIPNIKIIRLPGNNTWASKGNIHGQLSTNAVVKRLDSNGYKIVGWDIEWASKGKAPKESVDEMIKKVNQKLDDGSTNEQNSIVILSHDRLFGTPQYADSLRKFIDVLKQDKRNVFETIDHYPSVQN